MAVQLTLFDIQQSERPSVEQAPQAATSGERDLVSIVVSPTDASIMAHNADGTSPACLVSKAEEIRKSVFNETCKFVRCRGALPPYGQLLRYSVSLARQSVGSALTFDEALEIGTKAAKYIAANNDQELAKPAPARPGRVRAAEVDRILVRYRCAIAEGTPMSVRKLAKALGVSKTKVQNTLEAAGYCPKRQIQIASLSPTARAIVKIIDRLFSRHGKRAIELLDLASAVGTLTDDTEIKSIKSAVQEVDAAGLNIRILVTDVAHPNTGSPLIALSRGRRLDDLQLTVWLRGLISDQAEKKRLGLPKRVLLEVSGRIFHHPIARDLSSVLKIRDGSRDLDVWRDFITASSGGGERAREVLQFVAFDIPKMVSIAASYARLSDADPAKLLGKMHDWVAERLDHGTAAHIFAMVSQLMQSDQTDAECLQWWSEESEYLNRIPFLGDRDPVEFFEVLCQDNDNEDGSIWRAIVRLDEYYAPPEKLIEIQTGADPVANGGVGPTRDPTILYLDFDVDEGSHTSDWDLEGYILDADDDAAEALSFYREQPAGLELGTVVLLADEEIPI